MMRLHDLEAQLARDGYLFHHQRGSHRCYVHEATGRKLTVSVHGDVHTPITWRKIAAGRGATEHHQGGP